ncbi:MAG: Stk1 family PASTA domain-containing Ser/Thr kinase [Actinomycetes bacterium]
MNPAEGRPRRTLAQRYEVGDVLGRGGMATVHRGRDSRLGRQVAIKMLRPDLARDPAFHARFRREAQSAAALNHPSIVAVYDSGEDVASGAGGADERTPFIVMEYVEGRTLRDILRSPGATTAHLAAGPDQPTQVSEPPSPVDTGGQPLARPMEVGEAVKLTAGVLSALEYSHHAGIVHRDIKPANVMVTRNGDVKVMDFGIARAVADSSATMTATQAVIGTAQYLSPEQAQGEQVDARSDLYSTGCLLYELLTGRPPFVGDSPVSIAYQHVREVPKPPSLLNPKVPEALDRVVLKALAKDRAQRYQDARSFRSDLLAAMAGRPVTAPVVGAAAATATHVLPPVGAVTTPVGAYTPAGGDVGATTAFGRVDDAEAGRSGRAAGYLGLTIAVLVVLALVGFGMWQLLGRTAAGADVQVPGVVGLDRAAAKSAIEGAGLTYAEGNPVNDDAQPNSVVSQNPTANTKVPEKSRVTVVLSLGPSEIDVPDTTGMTEAAARAAIEGAGLVVGNVTQSDSPDAPRDTVMSTKPSARTQVSKGTSVDVVLSTGQVALPDLTGQTTQQARRTLLDLGLELQLTYQASDAQPDTVVSQDPAPGKVPQGSTVSVVAAQAAPTGTETTPAPTGGTPSSEPTATP